MQAKKFRYFTGYYFPAYMIFLGVVMLFIAAICVARGMIFSALALSLLSMTFFTGHYGLEIDTVQKKYKEYISILGFKFGTEKAYGALSGISVKSSMVSQTMYSMSNHATTVKRTEFDSYLEFNDGSHIHLISRRSKKKLVRKIRAISTDLCIKVLDRTIPGPDLKKSTQHNPL